MTRLSDIIPDPSGFSLKTARVIAVSGRTLTVDLGGQVQIQATDGCYPRPEDSVLILVQGGLMTAIQSLGAPVKQSTITVTASTSTTVTGVINGTSTTVSKSGTFTVSNGQVCPLLWTADGSRVWCLPNEQQATTAPPDGGGTAGPPPSSSVTNGVSVYPAVWSGTYFQIGARWGTGRVYGNANATGAYFYGTSRFRELQGRTIRYGRVYIPGSGTTTIYGTPHASRPAGAPTLSYGGGSKSGGGWKSLSSGLIAYLISGTGTGGLAFDGGNANFDGLPAGQIEIGWSR